MKSAIITDTHWGVRGDSKEFLDHFIRFYKEIFFPELDRRGINTIHHLGDIVDRRKYINFVTLRALREHFIEEAYKRGIDIHVIVGNHDIPYRNTNDVNAMRESFTNQPNLHLYPDPTEIEFGGCKILLMPWINSLNYNKCIDMINNTKAQVMFGHLEIKGFEMYRGMPSHEGFEVDLFKKFDIVASGHFHRKSDRDNIHYLGAPYEMTWSDYNDARGFHIFDSETREFEYIQNPLHMFHKILYNDENKTTDDMFNVDFDYLKNTFVKVIVQTKTNPYWFDIWLNKIYEAQPLDVSIVDDHKNMDSLNDSDILENAEDTLSILKTYVRGFESKVNKNDLDKLIHSLYNDAMNMEAT